MRRKGRDEEIALLRSKLEATKLENRLLKFHLDRLVEAVRPLMRIFKSQTAGSQPVGEKEVQEGWAALDDAARALKDAE